jgi:hypothetical protein
MFLAGSAQHSTHTSQTKKQTTPACALDAPPKTIDDVLLDCTTALKHTILTSKRNKMKDPTGVALLRGYENLHHIMNAKEEVDRKEDL